jgi:hypothetical protein
MHLLQSILLVITSLSLLSVALPQVSKGIAASDRVVLMKRTADCVDANHSLCPGIPSESKTEFYLGSDDRCCPTGLNCDLENLVCVN